jgi:hypothetical protein
MRKISSSENLYLFLNQNQKKTLQTLRSPNHKSWAIDDLNLISTVSALWMFLSRLQKIVKSAYKLTRNDIDSSAPHNFGAWLMVLFRLKTIGEICNMKKEVEKTNQHTG